MNQNLVNSFIEYGKTCLRRGGIWEVSSYTRSGEPRWATCYLPPRESIKHVVDKVPADYHGAVEDILKNFLKGLRG